MHKSKPQGTGEPAKSHSSQHGGYPMADILAGTNDKRIWYGMGFQILKPSGMTSVDVMCKPIGLGSSSFIWCTVKWPINCSSFSNPKPQVLGMKHVRSNWIATKSRQQCPFLSSQRGPVVFFPIGNWHPPEEIKKHSKSGQVWRSLAVSRGISKFRVQLRPGLAGQSVPITPSP